MKRNSRLTRESEKELFGKLGVERPYSLHLRINLVKRLAPARNINGRHDERLIHGDERIPETTDSLLVRKRLAKRRSEHNARIFDRMVVVHLVIALHPRGKIEASVTGERGEHMVEKSDTGRHIGRSRPVEVQRHLDVCLKSSACDCRLPHFISFRSISSADTTRWFSPGVPTVMRRQSFNPAEREKFLTRIENLSRSRS